jgi:shikimate kinase
MRIFLVGFMGCGKTTLGKRLAKKLNIKFVDMDADIESKQGLTIPMIFQKHGEKYFRDLEKKWLEDLVGDDLLISTGGGTPCFYDNMEIMNTKGKTVYINLPVKVLLDRLSNQTQNRPLIANMSKEELKSFIHDKLLERIPFYSKAQIHYDGLVDDVVTLVKTLKKRK